MVSKETQTGPRLFVEEPSGILLCSSCHKIMIEPVTMKCGHSFCKLCANTMDKCIKDAMKLDRKYFPNLALSQQVQELIVYCKFGMQQSDEAANKFVIDQNGCPEKIAISNIDKHESGCKFKSSQCRCGQQIFDKDLENHKSQCQFVKKPTGKFIGADPQSKNQSFHLGRLNRCIGRTSNRSSLVSEDLDHGSDVQRISDNLTLRMKRFETQMNGSLARMENMFAETQSMFNKMMVLYQSQNAGPIPEIETMSRMTTNHHSRSHSIASGSSVKVVTKWTNPFEFLHAGTLKGHKSAITSCVSRDMFLFTGYHNGVIRGWDVSLFVQGEFGKVQHNGECIAILRGHKQPIHSLFIRDHSCQQLVSFDKFEIRIWSLTDFSIVFELDLNEFNLSLMCIAVTRHFLFMSGDKKITALSLDKLDGDVIGELILNNDSKISNMKVYPADTVFSEFSSDKQQMQLYCGSHNEVQVWNIEKISLLQHTENGNKYNIVFKKQLVIKHEYYTISSMLVSHCYVIIGTYNRNIQIFNRSTGEHLKSLSGHVSSVNDMAITDNESHLVSVGAEGYVNIWELFRQTLIQSIREPEDFSASGVIVRGEAIFVVGSDGEIKLYRYDRIR